MEKWPLWGGGRCGEVAIVESWPLVGRWPLGRGGCHGEVAVSGEVAVVERWPLWGGGRCGEVAVVGR